MFDRLMRELFEADAQATAARIDPHVKPQEYNQRLIALALVTQRVLTLVRQPPHNREVTDATAADCPNLPDGFRLH